MVTCVAGVNGDGITVGDENVPSLPIKYPVPLPISPAPALHPLHRIDS